MADDERLVTGESQDENEASIEQSLRPSTLSQYIGQRRSSRS